MNQKHFLPCAAGGPSMSVASFIALVIAAGIGSGPSIVRAEEGMWTLSDLPRDRLRQRYNFDPGEEWLSHVQRAAVRLGNGCSGSFVSPQGLVMTNHHCAVSCVSEHSTAGQDFVKNGFYAEKREGERRCSGLELNQLVEVEDVTVYVQGATAGLSGEAFARAQKAEMSKIEKLCSDASGLRCEVVTLYHGGRYHLYKYHRYPDVRLVFAPEAGTASFGGDPDNFNYPRYALDVAFLRAYENNQPANVEHYLAINPQGPAEGDLIFAIGHPGSTQRLLSVAQLEFLRDVVLPERLLYIAELRGRLIEFGKRGTEQKRQAADQLQGLENAYKALYGQWQTLLDKRFINAKLASEQALRARVARDPAMQQQYGGAWDALARAQEQARRLHKLYVLLEGGNAFRSDLFRIARTLLRAGDERQLPNEERLREYRESALPSLALRLLSRHPIYSQIEELTLGYSLTKLREELGPDHPLVRQVLGNESPEDVAHRLITSTKLADVSVRQQLYDGGATAVSRSTDPMLVFARAIDVESRRIRKQVEDEVDAVQDKNGELVARALFAVLGTSIYPDATFTLRLTYGTVKGYNEDNRDIPAMTLMHGAFERHTGHDPFVLPQSWLSKKALLHGDTPLNFVSTLDIIGGNSGSPVLNRHAEIVGLAFDGNLHSLGGSFYFNENTNRCVSVHSAGLLEAMRVIYHTDRLLKEMVIAGTPPTGSQPINAAPASAGPAGSMPTGTSPTGAGSASAPVLRP
jgi:hypothetical protein